MKRLGVLLLLVSLTSCASWQQAINGYESAGLVSIKAANDNLIQVEVTALCGLPYSAILRHPELWDVLPKLCAPGADRATPVTLLRGAP